jgi:hypothetical protein
VDVSDLSDLLVAIGTLVGSLGGTFVMVWTSVVQPRREQRAAAKKAASQVASRLLEALADGELSAEELAEIRGSLEEEEP